MDNNQKNFFKEEGKASLLYCYDEKGNYVRASMDADSGVKYRCPKCGCAMHLVKDRKRNKAKFSRNPNTEHLSYSCRTIEREGKERTFAGKTPEGLIGGFCRPRIPRGNCSTGTTTGRENILSESLEKNEELDEIKEVCFSSLKQIARSGIDQLNPNDMQGDHKISDYIITYKYAARFFEDPNFDLRVRIVYARCIWSDNFNSTLYFTMFFRKKSGQMTNVIFRLIFNNKQIYRNYKDKFFPNDAQKDQKAHRDVLLASDSWHKIEKIQCKASCALGKDHNKCNDCTSSFSATFTNKDQLYIITEEDC